MADRLKMAQRQLQAALEMTVGHEVIKDDHSGISGQLAKGLRKVRDAKRNIDKEIEARRRLRDQESAQ